MAGILAFLKTRIGKILAGAGAAVLILFLTFQWGVATAEGRYARKAAKEAAEWAEKVQVAQDKAYTKGLQAADSEARRLSEIDQITRSAGMEPGADDESGISDEAWARLKRARDL